MIFHFNKVILWLRAGGKRELLFEPNKVNVITGGSLTGKTAILVIIDYCLFASHSKIPESRINENVTWYGINFQVNEKCFTICRSALSEGKVTNEYYFSSSGHIPDCPEANSDENTIKSLLETEFGIDRKVTIPFGGKLLKTGSKISLRYFLLFTTISEDIITNSNVFFDRQNEIRYQEALSRVFDLAVGIDNIKNILLKEKKTDLESEIGKLERAQNRMKSKGGDFLKELNGIVKRAKEFGLIEPDLDIKKSIVEIKKTIADPPDMIIDKPSTEYNILKTDEYRKNLIIRNLKRLRQQYIEYKENLKDIEDSVKPIIYLREKKGELIQTSIFQEIINALEIDFKSLKSDIKNRIPIDINISDLIHENEQDVLKIREKLSTLPQATESFRDDREKYLFLGELRAKIDLYGEHEQSSEDEIQVSLDALKDQLDSLQVSDSAEDRDIFIKFLEEIIQLYICATDEALGNYKKYYPVFDYSKKVLLLRKPLTSFIENVGSSSNYMFMHLFLFLGLHEAILRKKAPFVPSYLIIDQPSRPYWGEDESRKKELDLGDEYKIRKAFELLNIFMERMVSGEKKHFQMIILEHVPPSTWDGLNHVHLVEEFKGDNALIPKSYLHDEPEDNPLA